MRYKLLGHSGLRASELCLGTMTFGEDWGWGASFSESRRMFETFAEAGGNFIDTANLYTNGTSEKYVGDLVGRDRDEWVIATKYSLAVGKGNVNTCGNHRKSLVQAVNASLDRLRLDYIDLLWLHAWDFTTPVEEVMRALDDLVRRGKVLYVGISDAPAWVVAQANTLALLRGWTPFIGLQIEYSLKQRTPERELLPMADALHLTVLPWSPLGGGVLTGKYNRPARSDSETGRLSNPQIATVTKRDLAIAEVVVQVAAEVGCTPSQVALSWIRQQPAGMIPIIGARTVEQVQDNLGCLKVTLSAEQMERLDQVSAIDLGFPHDFFSSQMVQEFSFAGTLAQIDVPE